MTRVLPPVHRTQRFGRAGRLVVISEPEPAPRSFLERAALRLAVAALLAVSAWTGTQLAQLVLVVSQS